MRDSITIDKAYFENYQSSKNQLIDNSISLIKSSSVPPGNIANVKKQIFTNALQKTISLYSSGESPELLKSEYKNCIILIKDGWDDTAVKFRSGRKPVYKDQYWLDEYCHMLWMLSLGVLLDIADEEFNILSFLIEKGNIKDALFDFIISSRSPKEYGTSKPTTNKPFDYLAKSILQGTSESDLEHYLNGWYKNSKILYWHDLHKKSKDRYYGYWSFESAAVVKIMGLDDSSFKDHQYYPKDLVN